MIYGAICDRSDDTNPPPLPPEHPPHPSIMLHNSINNSIGVFETICNNDVAATDDDDEIYSAKLQLECEDPIGVLDGNRQDILNVESENYDDNYDGPFAKYQSSTDIPTTTPAPIIRTDIVSTEDFSSNLNVAAAAATAKDNGAQRHMIYDRSNTKNPPPLPPESLDEVSTGETVWNLERD